MLMNIKYIHTVLRDQWSPLLHSSNSRTSRCRSSSLELRPQFRIRVPSHKRSYDIVDASEYRRRDEIDGHCRQKVNTLFVLISEILSISPILHSYLSYMISTRWLLLSTLPVLLATLILLVLGNVINLGTILHAAISTGSVIVYFCCFVTGFGPVPNILCAEIFPTRVRGICIGICALTFWIGDIIVTYSLPVMLNSIGLGGVFGIYAAVCAVSWIFVFLKVPETKGMPLEVITEFFAVGARQSLASENN